MTDFPYIAPLYGSHAPKPCHTHSMTIMIRVNAPTSPPAHPPTPPSQPPPQHPAGTEWVRQIVIWGFRCAAEIPTHPARPSLLVRARMHVHPKLMAFGEGYAGGGGGKTPAGRGGEGGVGYRSVGAHVHLHLRCWGVFCSLGRTAMLNDYPRHHYYPLRGAVDDA